MTSKANRYRTCEEGSSIPFHRQDDIQDDSCDEYPFAGTFEGGTNGGLCAEILPKFEDGGWKIYYFVGRQPTGNEPCVRGHVPLAKKQFGRRQVRKLHPGRARPGHGEVHRLDRGLMRRTSPARGTPRPVRSRYGTRYGAQHGEAPQGVRCRRAGVRKADAVNSGHRCAGSCSIAFGVVSPR